MGIRDGLNSLMEGLVNEWIIVPFAENIGHDTPVTEIQDGTQIELMYLNALIPFDLRHIGQTFLIRFLCMELAVQEVVGEILWILNLSGTAVVIVFHSRPNISGPADTKHSFVIDVDAIVMAQVVIEPPAAFIRAFLVDFLGFVSQALILRSPMVQFPRSPFVVGRTSHMEQFAGCFNWKSLVFMTFSNGYINMALSYF